MGDTGLEGRIRAALAAEGGRLERALFGTDDPSAVAAQVEACCRERLGEPTVARAYVPGVGLVVSLGLPAPRPLAPPTALGTGVATFEADLPGDAGPWRRATVAAGLHRRVEAARDLDADVGDPLLRRPPGAPLWPEPHDVRFDLDGTTAGAEWIDELGRAARDRLDAAWDAAPAVVGHFDWRVQNLGFGDGGIVAVYDWDSIARAPEAVTVGCAAGTYRIDWRLLEEDPLPTVEDMAGFVADYEAARGRPFDDGERELLDAANLAHLAYGARCQHADLVASTGFGGSTDVGFLRLLRQRGERFLATG